MIYRTLLSGAVLSTLAACASQPPPTRHLGSALAATSAAQEAGASRVPPAALHVALAREQIEQAERMIDDGMNERAHDFTVRAYSDAKLASALAHEAELKRRLAEMKREADDAQAASKQRLQRRSESTPDKASNAADESTSTQKPEGDEGAKSFVPEQQRNASAGDTQPEEN